MLTVVGGTYREWCDEPEWREVFGSGLRAAAAVSARSDRVRLVTYGDDALADDIDVYAATYGIDVERHPIARTLRFSYAHPLALPDITPSLHLLPPMEPLRVESPALLRYGMLEGTAVVRGERVVYDPQSAYSPEPFRANGSQAGQLAVVANVREAVAMTGYDKIAGVEALGRALLREGADVVVIKRGARGLTVFTAAEPDTPTVVPAFRTRRVWPIGSGDVFSAIFAHHWAERGDDPIRAAWAASEATAFYCHTRQVPIPVDLADALDAPLEPLAVDDEGTVRRIYLAGPFFTMAERWLVREARQALLAQGVDVFSPYHDVGIGPAEDVVWRDIEELDRCDGMLALVDGGDQGTLFEVGYARRRGIPVVAFTQHEPEEALKMLRGTGCALHGDFTTAVYHMAWAVSASPAAIVSSGQERSGQEADVGTNNAVGG